MISNGMRHIFPGLGTSHNELRVFLDDLIGFDEHLGNGHGGGSGIATAIFGTYCALEFVGDSVGKIARRTKKDAADGNVHH